LTRWNSLRHVPSSGVWLLFFCACIGLRGRPIPFPPPPASVEGFSGLYHVTWTDGVARHRARLEVAHIHPDSWRLEILDPLGTTRVLLVAESGRVLLLDPSHRTFRSFEKGREAVLALTGLPLDLDFLAPLLLGNLSILAHLACGPEMLSAKEGRQCQGPGGEPFVTFGKGGLEARIRFRSGTEATIRYQNRRGISARLPRSIRLAGPEGPVKLDLEVRKMEFGLPNKELFSTAPPKGFRKAPGKDPPVLAGKNW